MQLLKQVRKAINRNRDDAPVTVRIKHNQFNPVLPGIAIVAATLDKNGDIIASMRQRREGV